MILLGFAEKQPFLFDSLPEDPDRRRRRRRRSVGPVPMAEGAAEDAAEENRESAIGGSAPAGAARCGTQARPPVPFIPMPVFRQVDAGGLTNPEILELIRSLSDLRLSFLVVEAVRELKRRTRPDDALVEAGNIRPDDDKGRPAPNPSLLRAGRLVQAELLETE